MPAIGQILTQDSLLKIINKSQISDLVRYLVPKSNLAYKRGGVNLAEPLDQLQNHVISPDDLAGELIRYCTTSSNTDKSGKVLAKYAGQKFGQCRLPEGIEECISFRKKYLDKLKKSLNDLKKDYPYADLYKVSGLAVCNPDTFSDQITKPLMRLSQDYDPDTLEDERFQDAMAYLAKMHSRERSIQQVRGDLAELHFAAYPLKHGGRYLVFPTLKHKKGADFVLYDRHSSSQVQLDVKTTRRPLGRDWLTFMKNRNDGMSRPADVIKKLYEEQGEQRFSHKPRLYLMMPGEGEDLLETGYADQLSKQYDINFSFKKKNYEVKGARIVFL